MKITKNQAGLFGGLNEEGETVIPFVFDEITIFGGQYLCRIWRDFYWYDSNGTCIGREILNPNGPKLMYNSRKDIGDMPLKEAEGVYYKYQNGKFGVLNKEGTVILPCEYDEVWRWPSCEVIEARIGTKYCYFDLNGNPILTKHRFGPVEDGLSPYTVAEQQNDIALMTMEFVDSCTDEQCCICYGRPTRLDRILRQDIEWRMREHCEYKRFPDDAFVRFNGFDNYIYRAYIAHGKGNNPIGECVSQLHQMKCYRSSWFYLDKVLTNQNTKLSDEEIGLLQYAANNCPHSGKTVIGYGIDNSLEDGEAKVFHIEYFADSWPEWD